MKNEKKLKNTQQGPWLTVEQISEYLGLSTRAIRDLEYRGIIPAHRLGHSLRFSLTELDKVLRTRRGSTLTELRQGANNTDSSPLGPFMAPKEAAAYLGLSTREALLRRVNRLEIPVYRISDRILRFRRAELDQLLAEDSLTSVA